MHAPSEAEAAALVIILGVEAIVPGGADLFMDPHRILADDATARLAGSTTRRRVVTRKAVRDGRVAELTIRLCGLDDPDERSQGPGARRARQVKSGQDKSSQTRIQLYRYNTVL